MFALEPEIATFGLEKIKQLAKIMKIQLDPEDDEFPEDQQLVVLDEVTRVVEKADFDEIVKVLHGQAEEHSEQQVEEPTSRDELWNEAERIARPILLLVARKSKSTTQELIAVWNSKLSAKSEPGEWIRIDLRLHPDPKLRRDGVLSVHVDHRAENSTTSFEEGQQLEPGKGEKISMGRMKSSFRIPSYWRSELRRRSSNSPVALPSQS